MEREEGEKGNDEVRTAKGKHLELLNATWELAERHK